MKAFLKGFSIWCFEIDAPIHAPWRDEERQARDCVVEGGLSSLLILEKVGAKPVPRVLRVMTVVSADLVRLSCCIMMVAARAWVGEGWGWEEG